MITHPAETKEGGGAADLLKILGASDMATARLKKVLTTYALTATSVSLVKKWLNVARERMTYTVAVVENDDIYPDVQQHLLTLIPETHRRGLTARTLRHGKPYRPMEIEPGGSSGSSEEDGPHLAFLFDNRREQTVTIEGHRVKVSKDDQGARQLSGEDKNYFTLERTIFTAANQAGRDAVLRMLQQVSDRRRERTPEFKIAGRWGGWDSRTDLPRREVATVVLPAGVKETLFDDLERFLTEEKAYVRLGIPYHRGYLLHGPPGTGKTSIVKAMGTHFGLDVYYIPLGDLSADTSLLSLVASVRARSILLLEDIDVFAAARHREDQEATEKDTVSLSGLLNALDGVATPHGLIKVLTTNDRSQLDDAVIREGRVDVEAYIGHVDDDQLRRLFEMFYDGTGVRGSALPPVGGREITPAKVVEVFKRNMNDPALAAAELEMVLV